MSRRLRKSKKELPPEAKGRIEDAMAALLQGIPAEDPLGHFEAAAAGAAGYEADLIELLGKRRSANVLNFLYQLKPLLKKKAVSRAARRAIYRLEQAGVKADREVKEKGQAMFRPRELRPAQGFLTAYEVMDVRYGMLVLPAQPMGLNVGSFVFSHSKGLETFDFIYHTEGQFKRLLKDMIARQGDFLFEVPPGHVRFVLAEAVARTLDLNRTLPQDYERFIPLAGAAVSLPEQTMIYDLIEADKVKESVDIPAMTSRLLENELLASWVLTSELAPYLRKIDEIEGSVLVLTEHQKAEQKQSVYEEAEREIFTPQKRAVLKRCLEETALLFWRRDEKDLAEGALALALNISPDGRHTLARRLDFAASLVQYSFDKIISASLKTGPAREPFQHSDSGLILPAGLNKPEEGV